MVLFGFMESKMVIMVMINIDKCLVMINFLLFVFCLKKVWYKFFVMVFVVMRSCDEMEFIIVVKIVDSKKFVISGWNKILEKIMKIVFGFFMEILK